MTVDDEGAGDVRARLDHLADTAPPVRFSSSDVLRRGRRRRVARSGLVLGGAAAALALVVAVPTVVLGGDGPGLPAAGPGGTPAAPVPARSPQVGPDVTARATPPAPTPRATAPRSSPAATGPTASPITGLSAAEANAIARGCARSFTGGQDPRVEDQAGVYAVIHDAVGSHALVYATGNYISCDYGGTPVRYDGEGASGGESVTEWLPGVLAVDGSSSAEGGLPRKGTIGGPGSPGYVLVEGRTTGAVARVVVSFGGRQATYRPRNRAYSVRLVFPGTWKPAAADTLVVRAYDRGGRLVGSFDEVGPQPCYKTPDGTVISGKYEVPTPDCKDALPWR
jgi:hypothetical protein